ncbi:hypothetical protein CUMW_199680, partial [Citrus unshiu]
MKFYNTSINNIACTSQMSQKHILKLIGCCLETQTAVLWSMGLLLIVFTVLLNLISSHYYYY